MLRRVLLSVTVALALVGAAVLPAGGAARAATSPVDMATVTAAATDSAFGRNGDYLALGDSVPFGYNPLLVPVHAPAYKYVGYPELAALALHLRVTNLSCPGQTTEGFWSLDGSDNGCFDFRKMAKLHTPYDGTQAEAAVVFLKRHPDTRLVTITLGANDLLLCQATTTDSCASEAPAILQTAAENLATELTAIRSVYSGPLIAVTYYSTDYTKDSPVLGAVEAVDATLSGVVTSPGFHGEIADGLGPFEAVSKLSGGDACAAGLLIPLPAGGCDKHPSRRGALLLAAALVHAAYAARVGTAA
jgi:hypothetical protein